MLPVEPQAAARARAAARLKWRVAGAQRAWASVWAVAVVPISGLPTPIVAAPFWPALVASWPVPVMPGLLTSAPGGVVWAKAGTANIIAVPSKRGLSICASPVLVSERVAPRTRRRPRPFRFLVALPGRADFASAASSGRSRTLAHDPPLLAPADGQYLGGRNPLSNLVRDRGPCARRDGRARHRSP